MREEVNMAASDLPDLARGVPVDSLASGEMMEGSYQGDPVLLARVESGFFAVGGECTHYGAPLCRGLLRGTTVLCPWHHARFDLASGRAVDRMSAKWLLAVAMLAGRLEIFTLLLMLDPEFWRQ